MPTMIKLICKECGIEFQMKKGKEKMFCSKKCKLQHRARKDEIYYITQPCKYCGNMFRSKRKEEKKFCSYKCSGLNKKLVAREERCCTECGKIFEERIKYPRKFCSEECRLINQAKPESIKYKLERTKEALIKKYGVNSPLKLDTVKQKRKTTYDKHFKNTGIKPNDNGFRIIEENKRNKLIKRFAEKGYIILEFKDKDLVVQHPDGHIFEYNRKSLVNRLNHDVELSIEIQPMGSPRTTYERRICKFLEENNIKYIPNNRKAIKGELDIHIPDYNLAIETNGLHWHSERYLGDDYHLIKTNKCNEKGIKLLHFLRMN